MKREAVVRQIIETYELTPGFSDLVVRTATRVVDERMINSFDGIYTYIAGLIERARESYAPRSRRLDSPVTADSTTPFHEFVGTEDKDLANLFESESDYREKMPAYDALSILEGKLDKPYLDALRQLMEQLYTTGAPDILLHTSPEWVLENVDQIQENLEEFLDRYELEGRIIIPHRPIFHIQFNPLVVKYRQRNFHGDPLAFFREHQDRYGGLTRSQLNRVDPGLYYALRVKRQLDEAIPENNDPVLKAQSSYYGPEFSGLIDGKPELPNKATQRNQQNGNRFNGYLTHDNAADYLRAHPDLYDGLSRSQLSFANVTLYAKLLYGNLLDEVIPVTFDRGLPEDQFALRLKQIRSHVFV